MIRTILSLTVLIAAPSYVPAQDGWSRLPPLPDRHGFAGPFAGVSGGALLVAGGANFPDKKPWEGGTKVWYDTVFVLERSEGPWKFAGRLSRPLGYGVSVTHHDGVVCVGGSDATGHFAEVFRLIWKEGKLVTTPLPPLPKPLANACGALLGDTLYVAGGQERPDATEALRSVFAIDLSAARPRWREVEPLPGAGRILAVAAALDGSLFVAGGAELVRGHDGKAGRNSLKDAYRYDPGRGWRQLTHLPRAAVAAPSPAPSDQSGFYVLGGDDGSQVGAPPDQHRGFRDTALRFDTITGKWAEAGKMPAAPVTVPVARWDERWVIPSGEVRPGVRSPDVWGWAPGEKE